MAAPTVKEVELGFVEKVQEFKLQSGLFPSKVGGRPAWLILDNLPSPERLTCKNCKKPCILLVQVYCPLSDKEECFHRTIFIFMCRNEDCCKGNNNSNFVVIRGQLPKVNSFYSEHPPDYGQSAASDLPNAEKYQSLCRVCGCSGSKRCSKCKAATYCSKDHQIKDWKLGHKVICSSEAKGQVCSDSILFPEYELVTEPEEYTDLPEKTESEKLADYEEFVKDNKSSLSEDPELCTELTKMANTNEDAIFQTFKDRVSHEPEQVLRYQLAGRPLFVSKENQPSASDIPSCRCGRPRRFEFQIMPQLLNYLQVDKIQESIDWGTLLIYTCPESCDPSPDEPYLEEFLWKQDFSNLDSVT